MLSNKLLGASAGGGSATIYSDDVFSAYTYTGNGAAQTINTGLAIGSGVDSSIDPYFDKVVLLLHADGTNASTTFVDSSLTPKVVAAYNNAQISTTQSKFGGSSAYFNNTTDGKILVSDTSGFAFGTGDFTLEMNIYLVAASDTGLGSLATSSDGWVGVSIWYVGGLWRVRVGQSLAGQFDDIHSSTSADLNTWYHVAATRSGSTVRLYLNGTLIASGTSTKNINATQLVIGKGHPTDASEHLNGYIDEVRITKGVARYTESFNVPTAAFPHYTAAVPTGITYTEAVVADAPVMYYRLNDTNGTAIATLGSNGTYRGTLYTQSAVGGPTGTGFLTLSDTGTGMPGVATGVTTNYTSAVTLEAWVNPSTQTDPTGTIIAKRSYYAGSTTDFPISLAVSTAGLVYFILSIGDDYAADLTLSTTITSGVWQHVTAVYRAAGLCEIYINGVLKASGTIGGTISSASSQWTIGSSEESGGGVNGSTFNGGIAEVAIYNTALSASRIYLHSRLINAVSDAYWNDTVLLVKGDGSNNSTSFVDSSPIPKTLTTVGGAKISTTQSKFGGSSIYLPSSGSYVEAPTSTALQVTGGLFTIEAWIYPTSYPTVDSGGSYMSTIVNKNFNTAEEFVFILYGTASSITNIYFAAYGTPYSLSANATYSFSLNTWYHVAAVKDTGNILRLFVNGALLLTTTCGTTTFYTSSTPLRIGWLGSYGTYIRQFYGYIDDLRITKGIARYTSSFSVPTTAFGPSTIDHSVDNYYANTVLLVHADGTNGATTFTDSSGVPKTLTAVGNAQISTSQSKFGGSSIAFDGTGDYITAPTSTDYLFGSGDFTIELWYRPTTVTGYQSLLGYANGSATNANYSWQLSTYNQTLQSGIFQSSTGYYVNTTNILVIGEWCHIALVRNGSTLSHYVNGVSVGSVSVTGVTCNAIASGILHIGQVQGYYPNSGYIDEIRITKGKARYTANFNVPTTAFPSSAAAIDHSVDPYYNNVALLLYGEGTNGGAVFTDSSLVPKTVTVSGSTTSTTQKKFGTSSLSFNGSTGYATVPNGTNFEIGSADFTVETWIYKTASGTVASSILGVWAFNLYNWELVSNLGESYIFFQISSNGTGGFQSCATATNISYNTWHHVAAVRRGAVIQVFLDGVGGPTTVLSSNIFNSTSQPLNIGRNASSTWYFPGYLDNIRITKGVCRYNSNFNVPTVSFPNSSVNTILPPSNIITGNGGLVWIKDRTSALSHLLTDSARGTGYFLATQNTDASAANANIVTAFNTTGFSLGNLSSSNGSGDNFVAWSFRKAPKFFDIVTYTGNSTNRTVAHNLGSVPGMIIIKRTDAAGGWIVYHRSLANTSYLQLQSTAAETTGVATVWNSTTPTSSVFSLGTGADVNANAGTFVAYLFAHDTATDGLIQCGSFTTDGSGNASVTLGWEPQYLMYKRTDSTGDWHIVDSARGMPATAGSAARLYPDLSAAEGVGVGPMPSATGFSFSAYTASATLIYLAIRRPNKPPTLGTQVYNAIARTGTGAAATVTGVGFAPDLVVDQARTGTAYGWFQDRLRGKEKLRTDFTNQALATTDAILSFDMDGLSFGVDSGEVINGLRTYINWFFKRAPGVFDEVCYTGTGVARTVDHGLGVAPDLVIIKSRGAAAGWAVGGNVFPTPTSDYLVLQATSAKGSVANIWQTFGATTFGIGSANPTDSSFNANTNTYVAYLFASKAGISKVGSYTGDGTTGKVINCGFTTGARFILVKRTDSTGDWFVWDTARGIVAGNDPHLSLNTTAAEVTTDDSIDPSTVGFIVNQVAATNINVTSATYIFLAIA